MSFSFGPGLVQQRGPGPGFTKQPFQKDPWRGGGVAGGGQAHQGHGNWFSSINPPKVKMAPVAILPTSSKIVTTSDIYTPSSKYTGLSGRFKGPPPKKDGGNVINNNYIIGGGGGGDGGGGGGGGSNQELLIQTNQQLTNQIHQAQVNEQSNRQLLDQTERELRRVRDEVTRQNEETSQILNNTQNQHQNQVAIIRQEAINEVTRLNNELEIQRQNQTVLIDQIVGEGNAVIEANRNALLTEAENTINQVYDERDAAIANRDDIVAAATNTLNTVVDMGRTAISAREDVIRTQQNRFETVQEQIVEYHRFTSDYIRGLEETLWNNANEMQAREETLRTIWQQIQATNDWQEFDYDNIQIVIENREDDLRQLIHLMNQSANASNTRFREIATAENNQHLLENTTNAVASSSRDIFVPRLDMLNLPSNNQSPQWNRLQEKIYQWQNEIEALREQAAMIRQAINQRVNPTSREFYHPNIHGQSTLTLRQQNELLTMNVQNTPMLENGLVDDSMLLENDVSPSRYVHQQIELTENQSTSSSSVVVRTQPSSMSIRNNNSSLGVAAPRTRTRSRSPGGNFNNDVIVPPRRSGRKKRQPDRLQ